MEEHYPLGYPVLPYVCDFHSATRVCKPLQPSRVCMCMLYVCACLCVCNRWEAGQRLSRKLLLQLYSAAAAGGAAHGDKVRVVCGVCFGVPR